MSDKLFGEIKFEAGTYNYVITPSGGHGEPPVYKLTISRHVPAGPVQPIATLTFEGVEIHALIENGQLLEAVRDFLKTWIRNNAARI
jgi:hypothetical protein